MPRGVYKRTDYFNQEMSKIMKERYLSEGGDGVNYSKQTYHNWIQSKYGKDIQNCERCNLSIEEYSKGRFKVFDAHCWTKDYSNQEKWNWSFCCRSCHWLVEDQIKNLTKFWSTFKLVQSSVRDSSVKGNPVVGESEFELSKSSQLEQDGYASSVRDRFNYRFGFVGESSRV